MLSERLSDRSITGVLITEERIPAIVFSIDRGTGVFSLRRRLS